MAQSGLPEVLLLVNRLAEQINDQHRGLYTLALHGLDDIRDHVSMGFVDQFNLLQNVLKPLSLAVAFTCYVLKKSGCGGHVSSLEQYGSSDFNIVAYPEVDLRLTVAAFLCALHYKRERPNALTFISSVYMNNFNHRSVTVPEFVQIMCERGVVKQGNISPLDSLVRQYRPSFFKDYHKRFSQRLPVTPQPESAGTMSGQEPTVDLGMEIVEDTAGFVPVGKIMYCKTEELGKGSDGTRVFLGCLEKDKRKVAVKRLLADNNHLAVTEMNVLRTLKHDNIIQYFDDEITEDFRYLVLEYCLGSLRQYVEGGKEELKDVPVDDETRKALLQDALKGLHHLHEHQIIHRDLKPEDILLTRKSRASTEVKAVLCDFGRSWEVKDGHCSVNGIKGNYLWIAPEILQDDNACTFAVDIFAMGCVVYYVLSGGKHPFGVSEPDCLVNIASHCTIQKITGVNDRETVEYLINIMTDKDRDSRPSAEQVLNHCYFWPNEKRLNFLEAVSNFTEKYDCPELEENSGSVVGPSGWFVKIDDVLLKDLKGRNFNKDSVISLLKAIRNKKQHYDKLPEKIRDLFGDPIDGFLTYFTSRFPSLLIHTYQRMASRRSEESLKQYYLVTCTQTNHMSTNGTATSSPPVEQDPINTGDCSHATCESTDQSQSPLDINLIMDKIPKLDHLMKALKSIKSRHAFLAYNLGVDRESENPNDDSAPLGAVLSKWLSKKGAAATWSCTITALEVMECQDVIDSIKTFLQDRDIFEKYMNQ